MSGGRGNRDGLGRGTGNEAATNIFRQAGPGGRPQVRLAREAYQCQ